MGTDDLGRRDFIKSGMVLGAATLLSGLVGCSSEPSNGANSDATSSTLEGSGIKTENSTPGASPVYATADLSSAGLLRVYQALGFTAAGNVALKLHMGEEGNPYYLQPSLLADLAQALNATFVDTTVLYGRRSTADGYASLAAEHGFAPVDILDRNGAMELPIEGGSHLQTAEVGVGLADYDSVVSVAHFKGHAMAGFGGTFKNLAIGMGTIAGKMSVHTESFDTGEAFLERVAEFAKGVFDYMGPNMACINVLENLSVDCDCDGSPAAPTMGDIGIMASLDPVALDRASLDQVYLSDDPGKSAVIERIESRSGAHLLDYAESLGMGSQTYEIILV